MTVTTVTYIKNVVITPKSWLQFRLQFGYSVRLDCNQFTVDGVRTPKKISLLGRVSTFGLGTRGRENVTCDTDVEQ